VRDGLLLTMIDNTLGISSADAVDRDAAIDRFAAACTSEHELAHGKQVSRLAGRIFEQIAGTFRLDSSDRPLLEAAARVQDVGYLINYDQHHKHSYHLVLNSRLAGFRPRELELIANVARYHRGARPKLKHANFRQLTPDDRHRVRQLAAILRLAGGLDRSHSQQVKDVTLEPVRNGKHKSGDQQKGSNEPCSNRLEMLVQADFNPEVDLWGARRRTKLFQKVFGTKLDVKWAKDNGCLDDENSAAQSTDSPAVQEHSAGDGAMTAENQPAKARNGSARKSRKAPGTQR
jgi:exopolyphosphatase/guanosine-5'-triphosphate,3'-diphosphate pyrophosphatase